MKENVINLKEVRDKIGLTQKETADKLGISLRTYQRYELDGDGIDYKKLLEISKQLGVSMEQLTGAVAIGNNNIAVSGENNTVGNRQKYSPKVDEFLELYKKYGNEDLDFLLDDIIDKLNIIKKLSKRG